MQSSAALTTPSRPQHEAAPPRGAIRTKEKAQNADSSTELSTPTSSVSFISLRRVTSLRIRKSPESVGSSYSTEPSSPFGSPNRSRLGSCETQSTGTATPTRGPKTKTRYFLRFIHQRDLVFVALVCFQIFRLQHDLIPFMDVIVGSSLNGFEPYNVTERLPAFVFPDVEWRTKYYMGSWYDRNLSTVDLDCNVFHNNINRRFDSVFHDKDILYTHDALAKQVTSSTSWLVPSYLKFYLKVLKHSKVPSSSIVAMCVGDSSSSTANVPVAAKTRRAGFLEPLEVNSTSPTNATNATNVTHATTPYFPIIWPLNMVRHFGPVDEYLKLVNASNVTKWEDKKEAIIWRGGFTGIPKMIRNRGFRSPSHIYGARVQAVRANCYHNLSKIDVAFHDIPMKSFGISPALKAELRKNCARVEHSTIPEQLEYKYILSVEGNDVSSGLKWQLASNSVVFMAKPRTVSFAMEDQLVPFYHYIPVNDDYTNLEEMLEWAINNDEKAKKIAEQSTQYMNDLWISEKAQQDYEQLQTNLAFKYQQQFAPALWTCLSGEKRNSRNKGSGTRWKSRKEEKQNETNKEKERPNKKSFENKGFGTRWMEREQRKGAAKQEKLENQKKSWLATKRLGSETNKEKELPNKKSLKNKGFQHDVIPFMDAIVRNSLNRFEQYNNATEQLPAFVFPDVEWRTKYYMGSWYDRNLSTVDLDCNVFRRNINLHFQNSHHDKEILYTHDALAKQVKSNTHWLVPAYLKFYLKVLKHSKVPSSSIVAMFVGDSSSSKANVPVAAKTRRAGFLEVPEVNSTSPTNATRATTPYFPIIWPLNMDRHFGPVDEYLKLVNARKVTKWEDKKEAIIWRGGYTGIPKLMNNRGFRSPSHIYGARVQAVMANCYRNLSRVDVAFHDISKQSGEIPTALKRELKENCVRAKRSTMQEQLEYKYILSVEGNDVSSGLKWQLASNSVVFMAKPRTVSFAMEDQLVPFYHYIPVNDNYTNLEEMLEWAINNDEKAKKIAEQSTQYMNDLWISEKAQQDYEQLHTNLAFKYQQQFAPALWTCLSGEKRISINKGSGTRWKSRQEGQRNSRSIGKPNKKSMKNTGAGTRWKRRNEEKRNSLSIGNGTKKENDRPKKKSLESKGSGTGRNEENERPNKKSLKNEGSGTRLHWRERKRKDWQRKNKGSGTRWMEREQRKRAAKQEKLENQKKSWLANKRLANQKVKRRR